MEASYKFFQNRACIYFPCHEGVREEDFNCLFCYCPLYFMEDCGGNFEDKGGIKSCMACPLPHIPKNYDYVNKKIVEELERRKK